MQQNDPKLLGYNFKIFFPKTKSNQIFHYTRCKTLERLASFRGSSSHYCAQATQLLWKRCRNGGESLATLCPILLVRDLNPRPTTQGLYSP